MEELYSEAMEALQASERMNSLENSDALLCECNPTSYRDFSLFLENHASDDPDLSEVLSKCCVAQGCRTCFNAASQFFELKIGELKKMKSSADVKGES